jgi:hypothetical protein
MDRGCVGGFFDDGEGVLYANAFVDDERDVVPP